LWRLTPWLTWAWDYNFLGADSAANGQARVLVMDPNAVLPLERNREGQAAGWDLVSERTAAHKPGTLGRPPSHRMVKGASDNPERILPAVRVSLQF